jgi:hypothetical protein
MRLTEIAWISSGERNVNSTLSTSDEIGWAIFILATTAYQALETGLRKRLALVVVNTHIWLDQPPVLNAT